LSLILLGAVRPAAGAPSEQVAQDGVQPKSSAQLEGSAPIRGQRSTEKALKGKAAPCRTIYAAVDQLLGWQQPGHTDLSRAAACLDLAGLTPSELEATGTERARQLKEILDARGLFVHMNELPSDPDFEDLDGRQRYTLFPERLPELYLQRSQGRWLVSAESVALAPSLHAKTFTIDLGRFEASLPAWSRGVVLGIELWKLVALLLSLLLAMLVRALVVVMATSQLRRLMAKIGASWGESVLERVAKPLGTLAAAGTMALAVPGLRFPVQVAGVMLLAVRVFAAFSIVWAGYRLIDLVTAWLSSKAEATETRMDDQLVPLVGTALKVFTVAIGIIFVLQNLNIDVGALLAGLGIGGLAFALAAQDTVKNLFGALTIFLDRPFQIGDWVVAAGTEGVVESVGFRSVRIRTFYNSLISVPNAKVADSSIDNYGEREYRRVAKTLSLTYDTSPEQMQAFVEGLRAILKANPATRKDYYEVHFRNFGESALEVMLYFFLKVPGWSDELRETHNIFLEILRLAESLGVDFAFPTQTLLVESMALAGASNERVVPEDLPRLVKAYGPKGELSRPGGPVITKGFLAGAESES